MSRAVGERTIMKIETSERLYWEGVHLAAVLLVDTAVALVGNTLFLLVVYPMAGLPWHTFGFVYLWLLLIYVTLDAAFAFVAAFASDATIAQTMVDRVITSPYDFPLCVFNGLNLHNVS